ncbi:winged helix-turn-helix domain-containing protein [Glaciihabitans sp. dw_435]|uniref:winged helix-turn-helix domain-containing protein n=1 Tax=Glaciihabitans sp. dw_435 TaxID=2720081 RepID=UPI001BD6D1AB|nr:crosslink repair DNA glycosylase YcaQ family protein [Glaciihabitans sp. dw_435]
MVTSVSPAQARRIALAAQGFGRPRVATPGTRQLSAVIDRLGILQLDSVNVFERSHYLPVFARVGAYDKTLLDRLTFGPKSTYTEYWAHVASIIPKADWPLWRWYMNEWKAKQEADPKSWVHANGSMLDWLRAELATTGPLPASKIETDAGKRRGRGGWWEWSDVKRGLEYLFFWGEVVPAGRTNFERTYGLAEQVLPAEILNAEVSKADAVRELLLRASRSHGIGTAGDLADYYRLGLTTARPVLEELADAGELQRVTVAGWEKSGRPIPTFLSSTAKVPRAMDAAALLSPFDPVVWERDRALRMFDFHYRIEIYTPAPKRIYGYYTLPVLIGDRIVGRVDLKSDRQNRVLRVQSSWSEPGAPTDVEQRIVPLLESARSWQGLEAIEVMDRGDLAARIAGALGLPLLDPAARAADTEAPAPDNVTVLDRSARVIPLEGFA